MDLLPGVRSHTTRTSRLSMFWLEHGPEDGVPVVLVHGNLSTSRYYEHVLPGAPGRLRFIVPDMRSFGRSQRLPIDATRGLRDWSDDIASLVAELGITAPVHLVGWSTGGAAIAQYAIDHGPVASLTFVDTVSPYGYGGVKLDGTPCFPDNAGAGGGGANPELVQRLRDGDRSAESPFSPRNVMNSLYWSPAHRESPEREDLLVEEMLLTVIGDTCYPGETTASANWPGFAPGTAGILNAVSPRYCTWSGIVDLDPLPPVLWTHGQNDGVVADGSMLEMGTLGTAGYIPGWPGPEIYPPQPMVTQTATVLTTYAQRGGSVRTQMFPGSGHGPMFDARERWCEVLFDFLLKNC